MIKGALLIFVYEIPKTLVRCNNAAYLYAVGEIYLPHVKRLLVNDLTYNVNVMWSASVLTVFRRDDYN